MDDNDELDNIDDVMERFNINEQINIKIEKP
jgi:hypothetical protein